MHKWGVYEFSSFNMMLSPKSTSSIRHLEFRVRGMSCASCSAAVKSTLKQKCGIDDVQVDLLTGKVQVELEDKQTTSGDIRNAIESAGFKVIQDARLADWRQELMLLQRAEQEELHQDLKLLKRIALFASPLILLGHLHFRSKSFTLILLSLPLHLWAARPIYRKAWKSATMERLAAISSLAAFVASLIDVLLVSGLHSEHSLFDCSAVILLTSITGRVIERRLRTSFSSFGSEFLNLPGFVYGPNLPFSHLENVQVGSVICIGSAVAKKVPFDGEIVDGWVRVDESMLTGEPKTVLKERKSIVLAGSSVIEGRALLEVKKPFNESLLSLIAQGSLSSFTASLKNSQLIDEIARVFTPLILALAGGTAAVWTLIFFISGANAKELIVNWQGGDSTLLTVLHFTLATLTVACPCALSLASPMAVAAAKISAKRKGIVLNDAAALQTPDNPSKTTLLFDKTGTLTQGRPIIRYEHKSIEVSEARILSLVREAESPHVMKSSLAEQIVQFCDMHGAKADANVQVEVSRLLLGKGIEAVFSDGSLLSIVKSDECSGSQVRFKDQLVGQFSWRDELRPEARSVLQRLRSSGFQMGIVSGDAQQAVDECAQKCGWDLLDFRVGDCDPFAKQGFVHSVQSISRRRVIFIGDGINDALAQSSATFAISMNPYAASTSSVTLLRPNLELIVDVFRLGRMLRIQVGLNLLSASVYNLIMLPWAMGFGLTIGLAPLSPRITSVMMAASGLTMMFFNMLSLVVVQ